MISKNRFAPLVLLCADPGSALDEQKPMVTSAIVEMQLRNTKC